MFKIRISSLNWVWCCENARNLLILF